jgi:hypothetical protein
MIPNVPLFNSSFGAGAYGEMFQSCLSAFYSTDGPVSHNWNTLIFGEASADYEIKYSEEIF